MANNDINIGVKTTGIDEALSNMDKMEEGLEKVKKAAKAQGDSHTETIVDDIQKKVKKLREELPYPLPHQRNFRLRSLQRSRIRR